MIKEIMFLEKYDFDITTKGCEYAAYIIHNYDTSELQNLLSVYEKIAEEYKTTAGAVERALRYAISKSYFKGLTLKKALFYLIFDFNLKVDKD